MSIAGLAGQKLSGTYILVTPIAHGAHGVVYEARHAFTGARHAVKVLSPAALDPQGLRRCRRDAEMTAALHHPGIIRIVDWSRQDALPLVYLVMEFVEGENVQSRVRRLGRLAPQQVLELGLRVGVILTAAHKLGVVHRGLTPRNLLYTQAAPDALEQGEVVKILDFGIAALPGIPDLAHATLPYQAPELSGAAEVDGRADQFSLAAILYEALSGRPPAVHDEIELDHESEAGPPPALGTLCPEAPPHMVYAIERGMSRSRNERFPSIIDFTRALDDRGIRSAHSALSSRSSLSARLASVSSGSVPRQGSPASSASSGRMRAMGGEKQAAGSVATPPRPVTSGGPSAASPAPVPGPGAGEAPARPPSTFSMAPIVGQQDSRLTTAPRRRIGLWLAAPAAALTLLAATGVIYRHAATRVGAEGGDALISARPKRVAVAAPPVVVRDPVPPADDDLQSRLAQADEAFGKGDNARAIELARFGVPSARAWRLIAMAACRLKDSKLTDEALGHLSNADRQEVQNACRRR